MTGWINRYLILGQNRNGIEIDKATKLVQTEIAMSVLERWMMLHKCRINLFNLSAHLGHQRYKSWKQFLDHAYWSVELKKHVRASLQAQSRNLIITWN